jgi:hypothetical protein
MMRALKPGDSIEIVHEEVPPELRCGGFEGIDRLTDLAYDWHLLHGESQYPAHGLRAPRLDGGLQGGMDDEEALQSPGEAAWLEAIALQDRAAPAGVPGSGRYRCDDLLPPREDGTQVDITEHRGYHGKPCNQIAQPSIHQVTPLLSPEARQP